MGVLGAYWYIFPRSKVCIFYWFGILWRGVWEVHALWVIGAYFAMDLTNGILFGTSEIGNGIANFAHVGGSFSGALMCLVMHIRRDTEAVSDAKAIEAETKDLSLVPLYALQSMLEAEPRNVHVLRAMIGCAIRDHNSLAIDKAFAQAGPELIDLDPELVAIYLLDVHGEGSFYTPVQVLRLAGICQQRSDTIRAIGLYKLVAERYPNAREAETALYRTAQCCWNKHRDAQTAVACLSAMSQRFPQGPMAPYGRQLQQQIVTAGANNPTQHPF
jgi:hypothetical protein